MQKLRIGKRFLPLKILIPILLISMLSLVSYAASVTSTTVSTQTISGVLYNVAGGFTATNNGFGLTANAATATTLPATWTNGALVTMATVAGNWQYSVTVTINAGASPSTTYTVSVQWSTGGGAYNAIGTGLTFTTPSTINSGQTMTFIFDTGVTTFTAPAGLVITIQ
jgi:hypothetical protein